MSRLERIKAREEATTKRSGRQDESWEATRRERIRDIEFQAEWDSMPVFRRDEKYGFYY